MSISYDVFVGSFLSKTSDYSFLEMPALDRVYMIDGFMKRAISAFKKNCKYDLVGSADDTKRQFNIDIQEEDLDEIADIISDGMIVEWLKPYLYKQELLENVLNTKDFTSYSPAELLMRVGNAYSNAKKDYIQKIREYSYNHGDLSNLHI